jgi:hypothetical protein
VNPKLAVDNRSDLLLDSKALKAVIGALRFELEAWQRVREEDVGEDAFADLQNDITYHEMILHTLENTYAERYGVVP